ncbi:MAG: DoxX family protein [Bacteroidota bacterium]
MKKTRTWYWIITGIFAAFMLFTAIPDVLETPEAMAFMTALGYPAYFVKFIGVAKVLGVIAILVPSFNRLKEWAYAGLFFDVAGATYSVIAKYGFDIAQLFMVLVIGFLFLSYYLWHRLQAKRVELTS